jgi:pyridoxamine 5'-phosphate oxidase family protein
VTVAEGTRAEREAPVEFTDKEREFLDAQPLARIATASGKTLEPDVAPVGFDFDGTYFYVGGYDLKKTLKYINVGSNPKVALVVDELVSVDPWDVRGIKVHGVAQIVSREGYMGGPRSYIRIEPTRKWSWGIEPLD